MSKAKASNETHDWRPLFLRLRILSLVLLLEVVTAGLAIAFYVLYLQRQSATLFSFRWDLADLTVTEYFIWRQLFAIVVTVYQCLNSFIDRDVFRAAPFYKLNTTRGMSRREALCRDSTSHLEYLFNPKMAGVLVWLSSLATALLYAAQILQAAVFYATNGPDDNLAGRAYMADASKRIGKVVVSPAGAYGLIIIFCLVPVLHLFILLRVLKRKTGLSEDPGTLYGAKLLRGGDTLEPNHRVRLCGGKLNIGEGEEESDPEDDRRWGFWVRVTIYGTLLWVAFMVAFNTAMPITNAAIVLRRASWLPSLFFVILQLLLDKCDSALRLVQPPDHFGCVGERCRCRKLDFTSMPPALLWINAFKYNRPVLGCFSLGTLLAPLLGVSIATATDISAFTFIHSQSGHNPAIPGMAGDYTRTSWAGNDSINTLFSAAYGFTIGATCAIGFSTLPALIIYWRRFDYNPAWLKSMLDRKVRDPRRYRR